MDDKTFLASYVAKEAQRINERLKALVEGATPPSDAERDAVTQDIEATLQRLQSALSQIESDEEHSDDSHKLKQ